MGHRTKLRRKRKQQEKGKTSWPSSNAFCGASLKHKNRKVCRVKTAPRLPLCAFKRNGNLCPHTACMSVTTWPSAQQPKCRNHQAASPDVQWHRMHLPIWRMGRDFSYQPNKLWKHCAECKEETMCKSQQHTAQFLLQDTPNTTDSQTQKQHCCEVRVKKINSNCEWGSFFDDENVLELSNGNSHSTLWTH